MVKQGVAVAPEPQQQQSLQPAHLTHPHQQHFYHAPPPSQHKVGNVTNAATAGAILPPTNATLTGPHLTANPIDEHITDFSLYENLLSDYSLNK